MTRIWYCANCGYEVTSRGRCHACRAKLTPSAIPELEPELEEDEVGYRIDGWSDADRGRLIVRLNDLGIAHRFEDDELVVDAEDEARVDDLVAVLAETAVPSDADDDDPVDEARDDRALDDLDDSGEVDGDEDPDFRASVRLLADAATRLRLDPTDMQADADVAEASAGVFIADRYGPFDEEAWSAIGRVTRRLLAALGAEEALEGDIRREAGILEKLLAPLGGESAEQEAARPGERTVYELPEWLPDQRAQLGFLLDEAGISYGWEGDELLVDSEREAEVEQLFDLVGGSGAEDDDEDEHRYEAVAELFAAAGRLAADPTDDTRRDATMRWIEASEGPPLLGMDEVDWFRIRNRARLLAAAIDGDHDPGDVFEQANQLHEMLRAVV